MKKKVFVVGMLVTVLALGLVFTGCASTGSNGDSSAFVIENNVLVKYNGRSRNVIIPEDLGITAIGRAFGNSNIVSVVIPNGVTRIGPSAFSQCLKLTNVQLPDGLITIGDSAFAACPLSRIKIPASVTSIDATSFYIGYWEVDEANTRFTAIDGVLFNKDITTILRYPAKKTGQSYTVPKTVTTIGRETFKGCAALRQIILPESLEKIETLAFWGSGITSISIPETVTSLAGGAFTDCRNLESLKIPNGSMKEISGGYFIGLSRLRFIEIPPSVTRIESRAFIGCRSLTTIRVSRNTVIAADAFLDSTGRPVRYD